ncbi:MAG: hypothetical protein N3B21_19100 [Clostridia bacterium]|nr:hypothetical protein [Clostridia bacterium]
MKRSVWERFKFSLLIILIMTSLIQVGILWSYQNHGLPTYFLSAFFQSTNKSDYRDIDKIKLNYFKPYRIIVSAGWYDDSHWLISMNNGIYNQVWDEAKEFYIKHILSSKPTKVMEYDEIKWGGLVARSPFVFEFKTNIKSEAIKWFLNSQYSSDGGPIGIHKIAVTFSDQDYNYSDTAYVYDGNKVYAYIISNNSGLILNSAGHEKLVADLSQDAGLTNYSITKEFFPGKEPAYLAKDMLVVLKGPKYREIPSISSSIPDIGIKESYNFSDFEEIAQNVLGNQKDSYDPDEGKYNTVIFKKMSSLYRIFSDGLMEYKHQGVLQDVGKGSVNEALGKAIEFIDEKRELVSGVNISLSGISESTNTFTFTFDYSMSFDKSIGDIPIAFYNYGPDGAEKVLNNAITIEANSKKVVKCGWIIKKFERNKEAYSYNVNFEDAVDNTFKSYTDIKNSNDFLISDIGISYVIKSSNVKKQVLEPELIVSAKDKNYPVKMNSKKGE